MAAAGIDPKAIDIVVISHLHPDHINGVKTADGKVAFPNAEIKVPALDWAFWMSDENMPRRPSPTMMKGYFANTRKILGDIAEQGDEVRMGQGSRARHHRDRDARPYAGPHVVRGRVRLVAAFWCSPTSPTFRSCSCAIRIGTSRSTSIRTRRPQTRHKFYDMAAAEKALVVGFHFPFPSIGYVEKDGAGYRLVPIAWNPAI